MTDAKTARDVLKDSLPRPRWIAYPNGREEWADQQIAALHAAGYDITPAAPVSAVGADGLLPCDFCGGDAVFLTKSDARSAEMVGPWTAAGCKNDQCLVKPHTPFLHTDKWIQGKGTITLDHSAAHTEAWNRRATPTPPAPAVRDDGARVRALEEAAQVCLDRAQHYAGMGSSNRSLTTKEAYQFAMKAFRSMAGEIRALDAADTGAGRDGDALDAARYRWLHVRAVHFQTQVGGAYVQTFSIGESLDEIVDAAIAAELAPPAGEVG